jgi:hypothetical protein
MTDNEEAAIKLIADAAIALGWNITLHFNGDMCCGITVGEVTHESESPLPTLN